MMVNETKAKARVGALREVIGAFPGQNKRADMLSDGKCGLCQLVPRSARRLTRFRQVIQTPFTPHLPSLSNFVLGNAPKELPAEEATIGP